MIDYSPSETLDYLMCPQYRLFRKDGWRGKIITSQDMAMIVGQGVHAGLAAFFLDKEGPQWFAHETVVENFTAITNAGGISAKSIDLPKSARLAQKTVERYMNNQRPLWCHKVIAVEERIGHSVIDLICEDREGNLIVVDHKTTSKLLDQHRAAKLKAYQTSWQMRDYVWRVSNKYLGHINPVSRQVKALINLIVLDPFEVIEEPIHLRPDALAVWEKDARHIWLDMSHPRIVVRHDNEGGVAADEVCVSVRPACSNAGYGKPCTFYAACHEGGLSTMDYIKVERQQ